MNWFFVIAWFKFKILDVILGISLECMQIKYFKITTIIILIQARSWPKICQDLCFWRSVSFHSAPETFENGSYRPHYPSRKKTFSKTLLKPEGFENAGLVFYRERKTFWKQSFSKTMIPCDLPGRAFHNHKSKMTGDYRGCRLNTFDAFLDSENSFSNSRSRIHLFIEILAKISKIRH